MIRILLLYATRGGSTREVANFVARILNKQGLEVDVRLTNIFSDDIHDYDSVILCSPIYKGVWVTSFWHSLRRLESQFKDKPVWGFSLCMRVLEPAGQEYARANYLPHNLLGTLNLQDHRFFGGRLENLTREDKSVFHESYDGSKEHKEGDYRDWDAIRSWALEIAKHFEQAALK